MLIPELKDLALDSCPSRIFIQNDQYSIEVYTDNNSVSIEDSTTYLFDIRAKKNNQNGYTNINWDRSTRPIEFDFLYKFMSDNNITYFLTFREVTKDLLKKALETAFPELTTHNYKLEDEYGGVRIIRGSIRTNVIASTATTTNVSNSLSKIKLGKSGVCPECNGTGIIDTGFYTRECLNPGYHE